MTAADYLLYLRPLSDPLTECIETVALTLSSYERIRSNYTWFVTKADHDIPRSS